MSPTSRSVANKDSAAPVWISASIACWRCLSAARSRIGRLSQRRNSRLPMGVAQRSMSSTSE